MYTVVIFPEARRAIKLLKKTYKISIRAVIRDLKEDPFSGKPLTRELTGRHSYKVGVYRIIYKVDKPNKKVYILTIGHRSTVYQ